jgi:hypothetical protein
LAADFRTHAQVVCPVDAELLALAIEEASHGN